MFWTSYTIKRLSANIHKAKNIRRERKILSLLTDEEYALIDRLSEQVRAYSRWVGFEADNAVEIDFDEAPFADPETGEQ